MRYDLALIEELCGEIGLPAVMRSPDRLAIELAEGAVLCFENYEKDDCLVEFESTPWHVHGDFHFAGDGDGVEMTYFDAVAGIVEGHALVCERWNRGALVDRWLDHRDRIDDFRYMDAGDEIKVRWIVPKAPPAQADGDVA
ncbi:MAG: hypothetical protein QF893_05115 [Alphaproteobacteria bacterium]|jgi:hypothetical protein|nr:hypothetical protein [Alphaproteobacteria bacterium]